MDLTGLTALDVAIGLAFLFFLLSTICSSINEGIAGLLGWRAQELEKALRTYLAPSAADVAKAENGDDAAKAALEQAKTRASELLDHPRIRVLIDHERNAKRPLALGAKRRRSPSYLPPRAVALTLLDTFVGTPGSDSKDLIAKARDTGATMPEPLRNVVLDATAQGRETLDEIREDVERSFDNLMDRCSGWYKRRAQKALLVIAALVTLALNANAFTVADRLAKDDAVRASVVEQAAKANPKPAPDETTAEAVAKDVDRVQELGIPVGWNDANRPGKLREWLAAVLGWLATIAAISLGAPFWFDVLGKFARLRNTGKREGTVKDDGRASEDRDESRRASAARR